MGVHDDYGKRLFRQIVPNSFVDWGDAVRVQYGPVSASIDGVIGDCCAIEIESRVDKQIRGAILDLLSHHLLKKLLVLIPAHMSNPIASLQHCETVLAAYKQPDHKIKVVLLNGTGHDPKEADDMPLLRDALAELHCIL